MRALCHCNCISPCSDNKESKRDKDNSELIGRFKEQIQDYIAPQYKNGNRRTLQ